MAWQQISPTVIVKGCKKCCVSSAVDETDDGMLWNGSEEVRNVRSVCEEHDSTDSEDGDSDTEW
jgi:hypothetical protein